MRLYEIPKGSKLRVPTNRGTEIVTFHHIDGMYSYITADTDNEVMHLAAATPMVKVDEYYEIDTSQEN